MYSCKEDLEKLSFSIWWDRSSLAKVTCWWRRRWRWLFCDWWDSWYLGTSEKSPLQDETSHQRGDASVNISRTHNVLSTSMKYSIGTNKVIISKKEKCMYWQCITLSGFNAYSRLRY